MKYIVECFNDECLLLSYGIESYNINHTYNQGKARVLNILSKEKNRIGMIDKDNAIRHDYFHKCIEESIISTEIIVYHEIENNNYLIIFHKKIETMFVQVTNKTDTIDTARKLGFDNTEGNYHNIKSSKDKLNKLRSHLTNLINKSSELQQLGTYIK